MHKETTLTDRFWGRVKVGHKNECWPWLGGQKGNGYGQFNPKEGTSIVASRMAWILTHGKISRKLHVCHKCDNPICCNPNHLFPGTPSQNLQDAINKGRHWTTNGERRKNHKLNYLDVLQIRALVGGGISRRKVAKQFGVSHSTVVTVVNRRAWRHVK
jgi:hypothetical protein